MLAVLTLADRRRPDLRQRRAKGDVADAMGDGAAAMGPLCVRPRAGQRDRLCHDRRGGQRARFGFLPDPGCPRVLPQALKDRLFVAAPGQRRDKRERPEP